MLHDLTSGMTYDCSVDIMESCMNLQKQREGNGKQRAGDEEDETTHLLQRPREDEVVKERSQEAKH